MCQEKFDNCKFKSSNLCNCSTIVKTINVICEHYEKIITNPLIPGAGIPAGYTVRRGRGWQRKSHSQRNKDKKL